MENNHKDLEKNNQFSVHEYDILALLKVLLRRIWLIILVAVICGAAAFAGTKILISPTYRCTITAYVNNQQLKAAKETLTNSDVSAAKELVRTYSKIITSKTLLVKSAESIGLIGNYKEIKQYVSTEIQDDTEIISIYVTTKNPKLSFDLANAITREAPGYVSEIVEGSSMKIIDYPEYSTLRYKPSYILYTFLGALIGAVIVMLYIIINYLVDDTVYREKDIEDKYSIPLLGVIPDVNNDSNDSYYYSYYGSNREKEGGNNA